MKAEGSSSSQQQVNFDQMQQPGQVEVKLSCGLLWRDRGMTRPEWAGTQNPQNCLAYWKEEVFKRKVP